MKFSKEVTYFICNINVERFFQPGSRSLESHWFRSANQSHCLQYSSTKLEEHLGNTAYLYVFIRAFLLI